MVLREVDGKHIGGERVGDRDRSNELLEERIAMGGDCQTRGRQGHNEVGEEIGVSGREVAEHRVVAADVVGE